MKRNVVFFLIILFGSSGVRAQNERPTDVFPLSIEAGTNRIDFFGNSRKMYEELFRRLNRLVLTGEGNVGILHIGDSHIQAGFIPEEMRRNFANWISYGCGARGLVFPYRVAGTNNPPDYYVRFSGNWSSCRNVENGKSCQLGLTGIAVETRDTLAFLTFHFRAGSVFREFDRIRIFHDPPDTSIRVDFPGLEGTYRVDREPFSGFTDIAFDTILDSLRIRIVKKDTASPGSFRLYGIDFRNGDPGIVCSAAGINGAEVGSFLRCDLLSRQLGDVNPDLVIVSLGTNDAYPLIFDELKFIDDYKELIRRIRITDPDRPVLLTVPGDSYRKRRYDNPNLVKAREGILRVAEETGCAVWDFYSVMGGAKSIPVWYKAGLVSRDKLHFTRNGYVLQADLLFDAFMESYSSFIDQTEPGQSR